MTTQSAKGLSELVSMLEAVHIGQLKQHNYSKYINKLVEVSKKSILTDGSSFNIIIQHVKTFDGPCFQRDAVVDVVAKLAADNLVEILKNPFSKSSSSQWNELACNIASLPDVIANCNAIEKHPLMKKETFYERLLDQLHESIEVISRTNSLEHRLFLVKLIGRIALTSFKSVVWDKFTRRAICDPREHVRLFCSGILQLAIVPPAELTSLELFIDHLCLPIFQNLKPNCNTGRAIKLALGTSVIDSDHLRYLICDKCIFKSNYELTKERQAIILFNIAAYLSCLVTPGTGGGGGEQVDVADGSLLIGTILGIVRSWTNPTKILIRTYQHNKYIGCALLIFLRHALIHDKERLANHANEIQSMLANSIPTYLNRASSQQRNLACCVCQLILPKLRDIILSKLQPASVASEDFKLDFKFDLDDDLLYLQRLFNEEVGVIFQDVSDTSNKANRNDTVTTGSNKSTDVVTASKATSDHIERDSCYQQVIDRQLQSQINESNVDDDDKTTISRPVALEDGPVVVNQSSASTAGRVQAGDSDDDDLSPYHISEDEDDDSDGAEFEVGADAACVPIYLRDCIDGLVENNNHRYVRLCLIKAGSLLDEIVSQQDDSDARRGESVCLAARPEKPLMSTSKSSRVGVDDTVKDVGVELARTLLFMDNQYNIENFDELRMDGLITLCYAAPGLVGQYLVDELNGSNRGMGHQLDILIVLVAAAHRLAFGSSLKESKGKLEAAAANRTGSQLVVSSSRVKTRRNVNRFAPYASLFFYGISHRLKADFVAANSIVTSKPQSVMSAFREYRSASNDLTHKITAKITSANISFNQTGAARRVQVIDEDGGRPERMSSANKSPERDSLSDDSYLLSRILLSISNILSCSHQQPVACKLSSDLLDILSAYRGHPDSGVQRSIMSCLKMIRDCTPSTYFSGYIENRMLRSFGPWLTKNESNIQS